ncbi:ATPase involved in chromosome partitioning [Frankia torreyi]|uniref:ATPase involved in chromosome partitioning n=2 Tax=Frankia TaxID=1854 RepID=A0A0D8BAP3_9ACTN|nr:ParA family protein [Frankia torreyi]KJE21241.1 ATPase involved in chromosome partitioning [Frankia torreyi]
MRVVTVVNYKGGVGKTTVTANLGAQLAREGRKVLLIDLDPQSSLTLSFYPPEHWGDRLRPNRTIAHWLNSWRSRGDPPGLTDVVVTPEQANFYLDGGRLDLVAADLQLSDAEERLLYELGSPTPPRTPFLRVYGRLVAAVASVRAAGYDLVLLDCAPNFGVLTRAAVVASDGLVVPARPDELSRLAIGHLRERLGYFQARYNAMGGSAAARRGMPTRLLPRILGVVFTMARRQRGNEVSASLRTFIHMVREEYPTFESVIFDNPVPYARAAAENVPLVLTDPPPAGDLLEQWQGLATEFTKRLEALGHA